MIASWSCNIQVVLNSIVRLISVVVSIFLLKFIESYSAMELYFNLSLNSWNNWDILRCVTRHQLQNTIQFNTIQYNSIRYGTSRCYDMILVISHNSFWPFQDHPWLWSSWLFSSQSAVARMAALTPAFCTLKFTTNRQLATNKQLAQHIQTFWKMASPPLLLLF